MMKEATSSALLFLIIVVVSLLWNSVYASTAEMHKNDHLFHDTKGTKPKRQTKEPCSFISTRKMILLMTGQYARDHLVGDGIKEKSIHLTKKPWWEELRHMAESEDGKTINNDMKLYE